MQPSQGYRPPASTQSQNQSQSQSQNQGNPSSNPGQRTPARPPFIRHHTIQRPPGPVRPPEIGNNFGNFGNYSEREKPMSMPTSMPARPMQRPMNMPARPTNLKNTTTTTTILKPFQPAQPASQLQKNNFTPFAAQMQTKMQNMDIYGANGNANGANGNANGMKKMDKISLSNPSPNASQQPGGGIPQPGIAPPSIAPPSIAPPGIAPPQMVAPPQIMAAPPQQRFVPPPYHASLHQQQMQHQMQPQMHAPPPTRPSLYQQQPSSNNSPASLYSEMTSSSYNSPFAQSQQSQSQQFQFQSQSRSQSSSKIDPDQIPSTVEVRLEDQAKAAAASFSTALRCPPPLSSSRFCAVDEGSCNPRFIRSTLYSIPTTDELLKQSHIPLGLMIQPLADLGPDEAAIPVIDFGETGPVRCSRCQAYANPYLQFINGGRVFICNLCGFENDVSPAYFSNLDMQGRRIDIPQRPELQFGSCEFAVQGAYCARPPQPATYLFAIDVSWNAVQSGMLDMFVSTLRDFLYNRQTPFPTGVRVGVITFDRGLHFYNLKAGLERFQMVVAGDINDVFCPLHDGMFVCPVASRDVIEGLLSALPGMFSGTGIGDSAVGSACRAAFEALKECGGKLSVFQTMLPTIGLGALKMREDSAILGTDKEKSLFEAQEYFWTRLGQECAGSGVCVDMYLFPSSTYIDVATLGSVPALSGGEIYFYKAFEVAKHGLKFANDLQRALGRIFGFDSVLRVRVSNGLQIEDYFGNFFMKNATDIECAGLDSLKAFGVILKHEGKLLDKQEVHVQAALLYTTAEGHRRVRVHNMAFSVTSQLAIVFRGSSFETSACIIARQMIQKAMFNPFATIRTELTTQIIKILVSYRTKCASPSTPGQLILPESFKLGPVTALSLLKTRAFRLGKIGSSDLRVYSMRLLNHVGVGELALYLYPAMYDCSQPVSDQFVGPQPGFPVLRLSVLRLLTNGIYLAENGRHMFLFVGKDVPSPTLQNVFGVSTLQDIPIQQDLAPVQHMHNTQIRNAITYVRSQRPRFMHLNICRQGLDNSVENRFGNLMLEDSNFDNPSYVDYLIQIHRAIQIDYTPR